MNIIFLDLSIRANFKSSTWESESFYGWFTISSYHQPENDHPKIIIVKWSYHYYQIYFLIILWWIILIIMMVLWSYMMPGYLIGLSGWWWSHPYQPFGGFTIGIIAQRVRSMTYSDGIHRPCINISMIFHQGDAGEKSASISTRWCPSSKAFSWFVSPITFGFIWRLYL